MSGCRGSVSQWARPRRFRGASCGNGIKNVCERVALDAVGVGLRRIVRAAGEDVGRPRLGELRHHRHFLHRLFGFDELAAGVAKLAAQLRGPARRWPRSSTSASASRCDCGSAMRAVERFAVVQIANFQRRERAVEDPQLVDLAVLEAAVAESLAEREMPCAVRRQATRLCACGRAGRRSAALRRRETAAARRPCSNRRTSRQRAATRRARSASAHARRSRCRARRGRTALRECRPSASGRSRCSRRRCRTCAAARRPAADCAALSRIQKSRLNGVPAIDVRRARETRRRDRRRSAPPCRGRRDALQAGRRAVARCLLGASLAKFVRARRRT